MTETPLRRGAIQSHLERLLPRLPRAECRTCECFQGVLVQFEISAAGDVSDLTGPHRVETERLHGCLGCDPCPPGDLYADCLRPCGCGSAGTTSP